MKQLLITPSMGKRLIAQALTRHPDVKRVLQKGTLAIIAGTTNGYVAEEILVCLGQAEGFSRKGFRRGMVAAPGAEVAGVEFPGDVIITDGKWHKGKTIFDAAGDLGPGDVILKGANAFDGRGHAAVFIGHPQGGTILAAVAAVVGRRAQLIVPVGLEKRVFEDVNVLAGRCNSSDAQGPRLFPMPGPVFTELEAVELMTGARACLLAAGGVYGAEGGVWLGVQGSPESEQTAADLVKAVSHEPLCQV